MHDAHEFLRSLTIVLAVAAVTTVLFQRLHQPVVLGYIVAGLIIGPHVPIPLDAASPSAGKTLADLNLRGHTGATVLAIVRADRSVVIPTARERLGAGDVVALAGTHDAIAAARTVLVGR